MDNVRDQDGFKIFKTVAIHCNPNCNPEVIKWGQMGLCEKNIENPHVSIFQHPEDVRALEDK
jgi:hypothetical protein